MKEVVQCALLIFVSASIMTMIAFAMYLGFACIAGFLLKKKEPEDKPELKMFSEN